MEIHTVSIFATSFPCNLLVYLTWLSRKHDLPKGRYTVPEYMALRPENRTFEDRDKYESKEAING